MRRNSDTPHAVTETHAATEAPEAQSGAELVNPYRAGGDKGAQVEEMFDSIAPAYDFMNAAMTFGLHRYWRRRALKRAEKALKTSMKPEKTGCGLHEDAITGHLDILDIATGTGDVAFDLAGRFPGASVIGVDLSAGMLKIAGEKRKKADESVKRRLHFEQGDSLALRFDDDSFRLVTVAYGVRNFEHLLAGLREMRRVLMPGGVICILELSEPAGRLTRPLYKLYARHIIPAIGRLVSGDSRAYSYLPESIAAAPQRERLTEIMQRAGLREAEYHSYTFGAATCYIAVK